MLTNHALVSIDLIRNYELSYVDSQTRERQDMHCLYTCMMDSLSQEGRAKVLTEKDKYTIPLDPTDPDFNPALSGNLLLKVVLMKSIIDNRSRHICHTHEAVRIGRTHCQDGLQFKELSHVSVDNVYPQTSEDIFNYFLCFGEIDRRWGILWSPMEGNLDRKKFIVDSC